MNSLCHRIKFLTLFQRMLSTHPLLLYQFLSSYQTFVIFSLFVIYSLFTLSMHSMNAPVLHTEKHNSISRFIVRTPSATMAFSNSVGVFGPRAILMRGDRGMAESFHLEQINIYWTQHCIETNSLFSRPTLQQLKFKEKNPHFFLSNWKLYRSG